MNTSEARKLAWESALVGPWYLRDDQLPIYELVLREKNPFIECARRYGKTTTILCFVIEQLLQNPGWVALWCEPDKNQAREIVKPEIAKLFRSAPPHLRPVWSGVDSFYWFPSTGKDQASASKLKLRGVNHDRGDSARGSFAHIIVADEFGTWKDPDYIVTSALRPQLQTTNGPFLFASTPPEDLGHPYYAHKTLALANQRFIQRVIYDNKSLTPSRLAEIIEECGGVDTPAFQREYLCRPVANPERLVIPEYRPELHEIEDSLPAPPFRDCYVGMDLGFNDFTGVLFGYWDFLRCELVIEDELLVNGKNSKEITDQAKEIEKRLWANQKPYRRISDNDLQQLYDMLTLCDYQVNATRKDDKLSAINELRLLFGNGKVKIKKRCKNLLYQLKVGLWNERRTDFQRGQSTGHLDLLSALIYLHRNLDVRHNPYPGQTAGTRWDTHWVDPSRISEPTENDALKSALRPFAKR